MEEGQRVPARDPQPAPAVREVCQRAALLLGLHDSLAVPEADGRVAPLLCA